MRWLAAATVVAATSAGTGALSQSDPTLTYLDTFYGMCLNDGYSFDRIVDLASVVEWRELSPEELNAMSPAPPGMSEWRGWLATDLDTSLPFIAIGGRGGDGELCGAFFPGVDPEGFLKAFVEETDAQEEFREGGLGVQRIGFSVPSLPAALVILDVPDGRRAKDIQASVLFLQ